MTFGAAGPPSVTVLIPTYQESRAIDACLEAVTAQTYPAIVEVLVIDGGSIDDTPNRARAHAGVTVLDNPLRHQAAALNIGIEAAKGDVIVRVDGHCRIAADYVERCVEALEQSGAALVGGAMTPEAESRAQRGIAAAMGSRFGAGPARFHVGGKTGWVDTVYLGAYRTADAREVRGYAEDVGVNEDAEFAIRIGQHRGVWFDPSIRSVYTPRDSLAAVGRQFYRYGKSRSRTVVRHPGSFNLRQMAAPLLVVGLMSPLRRPVAIAYVAAVGIAVSTEGRRVGSAIPTYAASLPIMHLSWGSGFLVGLARSLATFTLASGRGTR